MTKPLAIQTESLDPEPRAWLEAQGCDVLVQSIEQCSADELERASALLVRTYTIVDDALLDRCPNVRVVGRAGVALDNIDVAACRQRGVEVVHAPGANSSAVAEYVFALILDATRPRVFVDRAMELAEWEAVRAELIADRQLEELTLGVYGCGRIGSRLCRIGSAFNMRVIYHDIREIPEADRHGAEPVTREELLETADVVTIHVDDRPANHGLVSTDAFGRMKSDVIFISAARGVIVDTVAAAEFFINHPAAQGLFDVHTPEPFGSTYPLLDIKNVHIAPHIAAGTALAKKNMSWVVRDVWRVLHGERPENPAPASAER